MRISIIVIGFAVASYASSVRADDYKDATDAAYCVGVYQSEIEITKEVYSKIAIDDGRLHDTEQKKFRKEAFVGGAIKQGKIDDVTASKMKSVGYADANLCVRINEKCDQEWFARSQQKIEAGLNENQQKNCKVQAEAVCERAFKNCD